MAINRDEFDRLVGRVDRLETQQKATGEILASEVVGLWTHMDEQFAAVDARFDAVDVRFDAVDVRFDAMDLRFDAMDLRFEAMDLRFDGLEKEVRGYTEQVDVAIKVGSDAVAENRRLNTAVIEHFGIEVPEG